jgi:hypothetical protein
MANSEQKGDVSASGPGTRRKAVPIVMASGPQYAAAEKGSGIHATGAKRD